MRVLLVLLAIVATAHSGNVWQVTYAYFDNACSTKGVFLLL